ncbi:MAG: FAD:protein FMN transferase [Marinilabiliaceae bacterium]|nr:FAD:protein FMN transferase [Marinilabiliaceae bacterium]
MRNSLFILILTLFLNGCGNNNAEYIFNEGFIFGTTYHIKYENKEGDLHNEIKELLMSVNQSLSPFDTNSIIGRFNSGADNVLADSFFIDVFNKANEVYKLSDGAFDITIAPLVNLWGFGFEKHEVINDQIIDSLLQFVGMENIFIENDTIYRQKEGIILNASAIAKGYGVDVVAFLFKSRGINNFMIEIGGEVFAKGVNQKRKIWQIAVENPINQGEFEIIVPLDNKALATSGNYRNFNTIDGQKQGHIIDPRTGYPVQSSLLSASIIANNCMTADAFATACMVLGLEKSIELIEKTENVEGAFIYQIDENGTVGIKFTNGFPTVQNGFH